MPKAGQLDAIATDAVNVERGTLFASTGRDLDPPLNETTRPYQTTPADIAGGEKAPDSMSAVNMRKKVLFEFANSDGFAEFGPDLVQTIDQIMDDNGIFVNSPDAFLTIVEANYSGGQGLAVDPESKNTPHERMANIFQNTWAGQLLTYHEGEGKYIFTCDEPVITDDPVSWELVLIQSQLTHISAFLVSQLGSSRLSSQRTSSMHLTIRTGARSRFSTLCSIRSTLTTSRTNHSSTEERGQACGSSSWRMGL